MNRSHPGRSLRVLLDATAVPVNRGGVGRYVDDLAPALLRQGVKLALVVQQRDASSYQDRIPDARIVAAPAAIARRPARLSWEQLCLPRLVSRWRPDVVHSPHYTMPLAGAWGQSAQVVTIHDGTFFSGPQWHSPIKARFFRTATRLAIRNADAIVVPSAATQKDVLMHAAGSPALFHVAYHGVDHTVFKPATIQEQSRVRQALNIGQANYVAFLGTLEPRKNVAALVAAWVRAVQFRADPPMLILTGSTGWDDAVDGAIAAVPDHLRVLRTGYLPLADLPGLLTGATVVAYPSLGEGFGLPALEAMACGAAVLTTRRLSLPEVGGDAVAYCEPTVESIAIELAALLDAPARRAELSQAAVKRAASFTWDAAAAAHVDAYRDAVMRRTGR